MIDKQRLLESLRSRVAEDVAALERRQRDIQTGATHEEARPEHAKDTRATEQSYLARGLAERFQELTRTAKALAALEVRDLPEGEPVAVGTLVEISLEGADETAPASPQRWFVVPGPGGIELEQDGSVTQTLTPISPLGRSLLGLSEGDEGELRTPRGVKRFEVLSVR